MFKKFKLLFSKDYEDLTKAVDKNRLTFGGYFLAFISAILTVFNIVKGYWLMAALTTLLIIGFLIATLFNKKDKINVSRILMAFICASIFTVFAITGQNEGFAILWILLVPIISLLLLGLRVGFFLSLYFQILVIILFYTPVSKYLSSYYTSTFINRFPILYFAAFGAITFLMYQRNALYNKVNKQAKYDILTGLYNRNYFIEKCNEYRNQIPNNLCVISLDLNGLKVANDSLGHEAGDELIKGTAELLLDVFKNNECFRIGGDEFIVFTNDNIIDDNIKFLYERINNWKGTLNKKISLSIGCAKSQEFPNYSIDQLIKESDKRMYSAKNHYYLALN